MAKDAPVDFFDEFDALLSREPFQPFTILLMNGDRVTVEAPDQCVPLAMMYAFYPPRGGAILFPFPNVCAIELHPD